LTALVKTKLIGCLFTAVVKTSGIKPYHRTN